MATEEIEISELEFTEELASDNLIPVESSTDTKATSLQAIKSWFSSFFVGKTGNEEINGDKTFKRSLFSDLSTENKDVVITTGSNNGELKISQYNIDEEIYARFANKNKNTNKNSYLDIRNPREGKTLIQLYAETTRCPASSDINSIITTLELVKSRAGRVVFGNGIILQWGYTEKQSQGTITFEKPFSNGDYVIVFVGEWGSDGVNYTINEVTSTSVVYNCSRNDITGRWFAIGY